MLNNLEVYKMRDHNLSIEEDVVNIVEFDNLTDEQLAFLKEIVMDSVWYDYLEAKDA